MGDDPLSKPDESNTTWAILSRLAPHPATRISIRTRCPPDGRNMSLPMMVCGPVEDTG